MRHPLAQRLFLLTFAAVQGIAAAPGRTDEGPAAVAPVAPPVEPAPPAPPVAPFVPSAERGYRWLTTRSYVPSSFDQTQLDRLWTLWPAAAREAAQRASPEERRQLTFRRYGFTPRPGDASGLPLQYVRDEQGRYSMSCLACHAGQVGEQVLPGLPNAHLALQDLTDDLTRLRTQDGRRASLGEAMWLSMPLGGTHGTTNAVMFSVALLAYRDKDLNVVPARRAPRFTHHDLDAPPWWHVARRKTLYIDGFAPKGHRPLMQFLLVPTNGPRRLKEWENDFRDIQAYIETVAAPTWPFEVPEAALVARGKSVFESTCSTCHGTYGATPTYPERRVPLTDVGTDPVRLGALSPAEREAYAASWFTDYRPEGVSTRVTGYVAPPLNGLWASAPYFHNGSVPTLWHVLHPEQRPRAWRRASAPSYDRERVGIVVLDQGAGIPADSLDPWTRRSWFDTGEPGKSAAGHEYPRALSEEQRRALLAYLKTL